MAKFRLFRDWDYSPSPSPAPPEKKTPKNMLWTKREVEAVLDLWNDHTVVEIANAINRGVGSVQYIVAKLRKAGFKLAPKYFPREEKSSQVIMEALEELRQNKNH